MDPATRAFHGMYDRIQVDEKWFYLKEGKLNAILAPVEDLALRNIQSKRFITKLMFLSAVPRPIFDNHGKVLFDGNYWLLGFYGRGPGKALLGTQILETSVKL